MKIFFTAEYSENELKPLYEMGDVTVDGWALGKAIMTEAELMEKTKDADIIIVSYDDVTKNVIDNAKNLKLIACTRATPVNVDLAAAKERGIPVIYTPGRNSDTTAEFTIALMLSIARNIPMAHMALKQGKYTGDSQAAKDTKDGLAVDMIWDMTAEAPYMTFKGTQLKGKTLGIVGYGSIGRRVGKVAQALGMGLLIYDPFLCQIDIEEIGIKKAEELEELMSDADFITCHMKITPETTGIISKEMIALMKETAYFINSSRGAILDEEALIEALREKRIAGAAFDVYASEPLAIDHPYVAELDNVVIAPHIGGATNQVLVNHTIQVVSDVRRFLDGKRLLYEYHS